MNSVYLCGGGKGWELSKAGKPLSNSPVHILWKLCDGVNVQEAKVHIQGFDRQTKRTRDSIQNLVEKQGRDTSKRQFSHCFITAQFLLALTTRNSLLCMK